MTDDEFFQWLHELSDDELATRLERGGTLFAPNPHLILEAAKRLHAKAKETEAAK